MTSTEAQASSRLSESIVAATCSKFSKQVQVADEGSFWDLVPIVL